MEERSTLSVSIQKVRSAMIGYVNGDSDAAITAQEKKRELANTKRFILQTHRGQQGQGNLGGRGNSARSAGNGTTGN